MHVGVTHWLGMEFIELSAEAAPGATARDQTDGLFAAFSDVLGDLDLTLADSLRSRLFGRDRGARDDASDVRRETLAGPARAATSSYIAPGIFASDAKVAMDLIARRPGPGLEKAIRENEPPRLPCRYLTCGPLIVLSGQTAVLPNLDVQLKTDILPRITEYLAEAGSSWKQVVQTTCYLHTSQSPDHLRALFSEVVPVMPQRFEIRFVEGYSVEGKLVEVEVTALREF
jgi:enamine deaminase RidA (YjgF/YER057c/UK114 family)